MKALNTKLFIEKARQLHSNAYRYSKVFYVNNKSPVVITCPKHGDFLQLPNSHLLKKGCKKCKKCYSPTSKEFIDAANNVHKGRYLYSETRYQTALKKVEIMCRQHGKFFQSPSMHLSGRGCPKCASNYKKTLAWFVQKAKNVHCGLYDYSKSIYIRSNIKTIITCPRHGDFWQTPSMHLLGNGCPKCKFSKGELKIWKWLSQNKRSFIPQKTFSDCINPKTNAKLKFDFYLPKENILIEYNGEQHYKYHRLVGGIHRTTRSEYSQIRYRDKLKVKYAKFKGIRFVRISYKQYEKIEEILDQVLCQKPLLVL